MPLSKDDIERIGRSGFQSDYYVVNRSDWLQLLNREGRCVFNDGKRCLIYEIRPEGCRLYPIVYDENSTRAILHAECPHRDEFRISETDLRMLSSLLKKLKGERRQRRRNLIQ